LLANGSLPGSDRPIGIAPGRAPNQLARILEALGGIGPMTVASLGALLERESHKLPLGATVAVVTALMPDPLAAAVRRLHDSGQRVAVLAMIDDDWSDLLGEAPVQCADQIAFEPEETPATKPRFWKP
jgi:uncharacterized protein (DUF58 family)